MNIGKEPAPGITHQDPTIIQLDSWINGHPRTLPEVKAKLNLTVTLLERLYTLWTYRSFLSHFSIAPLIHPTLQASLHLLRNWGARWKNLHRNHKLSILILLALVCFVMSYPHFLS
jgi:hypothetical protein